MGQTTHDAALRLPIDLFSRSGRESRRFLYAGANFVARRCTLSLDWDCAQDSGFSSRFDAHLALGLSIMDANRPFHVFSGRTSEEYLATSPLSRIEFLGVLPKQ